MSVPLLRYLPPLLLPLLLAACQHGSSESAPAAPPSPPSLEQVLEQQLADDDLSSATTSLRALQEQRQPGPELETYQRRLAEAWLKRGERALERGDMSAAATALGNARALMPRAPALTDDLRTLPRQP